MDPVNPYESRKLLDEYLLFHYGKAADILPESAPAGMGEALNFAVRTTRHFSPGRVARSLDLGCSVGRSAYELARYSDETVAIDFSQRFISAARDIGAGPVTVMRHDEGSIMTPIVVSLPNDTGTTYPLDRLQFEVGDAMQLRDDLGTFNRLHAANLLCRLGEPQRLLERLPHLLVAGGELVLATPATWMEEFTPSELWPPGKTLDWLQETLQPHFILKHAVEEPFLIRETARKYQWSLSQTSLWQRR